MLHINTSILLYGSLNAFCTRTVAHIFKAINQNGKLKWKWHSRSYRSKYNQCLQYKCHRNLVISCCNKHHVTPLFWIPQPINKLQSYSDFSEVSPLLLCTMWSWSSTWERRMSAHPAEQHHARNGSMKLLSYINMLRMRNNISGPGMDTSGSG